MNSIFCYNESYIYSHDLEELRMNYMNKDTKIYIYAMPALDSRMYILINNTDQKEALIIDPLIHEDAIHILQNLKKVTVLLTHSHHDHISGVNWLRSIVDTTVFCSSICAEKIADPMKNFSAFAYALVIGKTEEEQKEFQDNCDTNYRCSADRTFDKETTFAFGDYQVEIKYTPGHSDCSQCILLTSSNENLIQPILFTGDSLVNGYKTITRLPTGNKKDFQQITKPFLDSFPDDTLIMPGHGDWGKKSAIQV